MAVSPNAPGGLVAGGGGILRNRRANPRDAATIARWMIEDLPVPSRLAPVLGRALGDLLAEERVLGVCVEASHPADASTPTLTLPLSGGGNSSARGNSPGRGDLRRPVAFGLSAFLSDACVTAQIAAPKAHFALGLLEHAFLEKDASRLLPLSDIAGANAGDGLNLFPFLWIQRPQDLSSPEGRRLIMRAMTSLIEDHKGYNLKCVLKEAGREQEEGFLRGGLKKIARCAAGSGASADERFLFRLTREEAWGEAHGAGVSLLFAFDRPRCGFGRLQQHVLIRAADDMTDEEVADQLGLTKDAVNMRWRGVYSRIDGHEELAALVYDRSEADAATSKKRRRVVAYVRAHPEELRPYAWK